MLVNLNSFHQTDKYILKYKIQWFLIFIFSLSLNAQKKKYDYNDGPYITKTENHLFLKWIENGKAKDSMIQVSQADYFIKNGFPSINLNDLEFEDSEESHFENVTKIAAISDIHGQFDLFIDLMKAQGVIDNELKWNYGGGHLVIVGDVFDRGDKVTETLWFLFNLEKQAMLSGGKVHVLLGNHELMVLHHDVTYINPKYRYSSGALGTPYPDFFTNETVLGQWLLSKNVSLSINDIAFVHGGFSEKVLKKESSLKKINNIFKEEILPNRRIGRDPSPLISLLYFENGPLWYRGYANPEGFDIATANSILEALDKKKIIVGHTSMPQIISLHDNKIFLIDSSIKFGNSGEILMYENDSFYRGLLSGEKILIDGENHETSRSPFQYVYDLGDTDLKIKIQTDIKNLIANKEDEPWQDAKLFAYHNNEFNRVWDIRLRARGNMRKRFCHLPPVKIDFSKSTLNYLGFADNDKLKLVLPCNKGKEYQQGLYKEYLVYKLYEVLDTLAIRTRLIDIEFEDNGKSKYDFKGICIEDEKNLKSRLGCEIIEEGIVTSDAFEREDLCRFALFQYMILNTDWSFYNKHNVEILNMPGLKRLLVLPYDFDYSGIVNQSYASPAEKLPIDEVRQALFRCKGVTEEEMEMMADFFGSKKSALIAVIDNADFLSKKNRKRMKEDILGFYKDIEDKKRWKRRFLHKK